MSRPRIALVVNPAAGAHHAADLIDHVITRLCERADVVVVTGDTAAESAVELRGVLATSDAVLAMGGDGTVHLAVQELAGTQLPLGVIPAGTGNDIGRILGMPSEPLAAADAVLDALATGSTRRVDLGRVDGADGPRWWVTILCAGFDSAVNERANRMRWPRGPHRYDVGIAVEALRLAPRRYRLELDGVVHELDATMVSICNAAQYGGGKLLAPAAVMDDGVFDVCVIGVVNRRTLLRLATTLDVGGHVGHPQVSFHTARTVSLTADRVAYADGERMGTLPLTTTCVPDALTLLVATPAPGGTA